MLQWCLFRYLHPANHYLVRITKADKGFVKSGVKIRDIHKIRHLQDR